MKIKTSIGEIKDVIESSLQALCSLKDNELFFESEDLVYEIVIIDLKMSLGTELEKAKKLINGN